MGRKWKKRCLIVTLLLGLGISFLQIRREQMRMGELIRQAEKLEMEMASLGREEAELHRNLAKWYNYNLELGTPGLESSYETILNFGQGRMVVLAVPDWDLKLSIYHGSGGTVYHDPSTPLPIGGRGNHTILWITQPFPWTEGMNLYINCLGKQLLYRVESVQVMRAGWSVERPKEGGQDLLSLVYDGRNTRCLVRCVRCDELVLREGKTGELDWSAIPAILVPGLLFFVLWLGRRYISSAQRTRKRGFFHKTRGKTKLL